MPRPPRTAATRRRTSCDARCALDRDFPFEPLSRLAQLESYRKEINRPIYHVHKWWATRLGSVFRAILLGAILEPEADLFDAFYKPHDCADRIVLDPFMGSGTTIGEALKLGCRAIGVDINPLPCLQFETVLRACSGSNLHGAYERLERRVGARLRALYRSTYRQQPAEILYTFWVKLVDCPDCGRRTRLFDRWLFAAHAYPRRHPESHALCPGCEAVVGVSYSSRTATCPECGLRFDPQAGPAGRATFVCEACGKSHRIVDAVRLRATPPEHQMYALLLLLPDGSRVYKRPDRSDHALYDQASRALRRRRLPLPQARILPGHNTDQARRYNYLFWRQMFNDRQLLALGELLKGILQEPDHAAQDALLLLFSGVLEFNNMFCSFKGEGTGAVRHLFAHHIFRPPRTPLEANPWGAGNSSGSFSALFRRRLVAAQRYCQHPFELAVAPTGARLAGRKVFGLCSPLRVNLADSFGQLARAEAHALILNGDSSRLPVPDRSIDLVVTDPPYFDNVHYSELADFFYCWLRGPLAKRRPAFAKSTTRSPREVQGTSEAEFGERLGGVLKECTRVLKPQGTIAFTFHHSRREGWLGLVRALRIAGLQVSAAHPVVGELPAATPKRQAREPIVLDLVVVCRPGATATRPAAPGASLTVARRAAAKVIDRFRRSGHRLSRGDVRVILMGQVLASEGGLATFSHHSRFAQAVEKAIDELGARLDRPAALGSEQGRRAARR
jgi:putative DNA methylase